MAAQEEFEKTMREKYGGLKTVKAFQDLVFKAYDDNLDGLLKFLEEDRETMEANILTPINDATVSTFVQKYGINPEILIRLLNPLCQSLRDPLLEGFYDKTNDFGGVSNSKRKKKKKKNDVRPLKSKAKSSANKARKSQSDRLNRLSLKKQGSKEEQPEKTEMGGINPMTKTISAPPQSNEPPSSPKRNKKAVKISKTPNMEKKKRKGKSSKNKKSKRSRTVSPNRSKKGRRSAPPSEDEDESDTSQTTDTEREPSPSTGPGPNANIEDDAKESDDEKAPPPMSYDDYISNYHHKFVSESNLTLPVAWTCLYYHQMGADLEFDADDIQSAWNEGTLIINKEEQDEDGRDGDGDENGMDAVPDTVFDFKKDSDICFDKYDNRKIYVYRIRRWISEEIDAESKGPTYSWNADHISYLDDYPLTDDLIVIQDTDCLSTPTWCKWIDSTENGMNFIRDSGFFKRDSKGICGVIDGQSGDILKSGVCAVGDFKFGFQPDLENDMDLYGIIRLDVLTPSLFRFPFLESVGNLGKSRHNEGVFQVENDGKMAVIQNGALHFGNEMWYGKTESKLNLLASAVTMRLDLKPLVTGYNEQSSKRDLPDIWTLFLSFSHPIANRKGERSTLLFKKHCIDLTIENRYEKDGDDDTLVAEELVLKIYSKNSGSRFIEIFREQIVSRKRGFVNSLVISFGTGGALFAALNGRRLRLKKKKLNRTSLFKIRPSSVLLLGHKCTSGDTGSVHHVFNGDLMQFALYPKQFSEFEIRAFHQQSLQHAAKYRDLLIGK